MLILDQLPYRQAVQERYGVVACFSPLFYNERWQLLHTSLEIYRQFGVDLQVYYVYCGLFNHNVQFDVFRFKA